VAERRSGTWFDPELVKALGAFRRDGAFWATLAEPDLTLWEPEDRLITVDDDQLLQIATAFAAIVDAKSPWTYFHSDRTALIATNMGAALGLDSDELGDLRRVALLHDVGKLAISNRILDKPGQLTPAEFERVKEHPLFSRWVLERVSCFESLASVAAAHHERLDGSGYPLRLGAGDLTLPMRVLSVADVYEALTAERPYRPAMDEDEALAIIRRDVPQRLDGDAYEALETVIDRPPAA
jgi:HD-GYP domain-containing protein (c-di-GMP phosphodiesterase class II)